MPRRPVIAYHIILTCYGFWLPNDERGSGSDRIWADHLKPFGEGTKHLADGNHSVAGRSFDRENSRAARRALKYPRVVLDGRQAQVIGRAMGVLAQRDVLTFRAFSIMRDHLHAVVLRTERSVEQMMTRMKSVATRALVEGEIHPLQRFATPG